MRDDRRNYVLRNWNDDALLKLKPKMRQDVPRELRIAFYVCITGFVAWPVLLIVGLIWDFASFLLFGSLIGFFLGICALPLYLIGQWVGLSRAARRTSRCPACLYDLSRLIPEPDDCTICPECGGAWLLSPLVQRESATDA